MSQAQRDDAVLVSGALTSLVGSGLPIEQGLRAAAQELPRGRVSRALARLAERMERGETFEQATGDRAFPPHLRALVAGGVRSASLGRLLEEFVAAERHAADVYRRIMLAISYPSLLLLLMACVFAFFCFYVVPGIMEIHRDFDANLPVMTVSLGEMAQSGHWVVVGNILVIIVGWLAIWMAIRVPELRTLLLAVPLLGPVIRWAALARFSRLLALLLDTEVGLPDALELAGRGCQDSSLNYACMRVAESVRGGTAFADALAARRQFPTSLAPMVAWAEPSAGRQQPTSPLGDALRTAAELYEGRLDAQLTLLRAVVPPICFLLVLWGSAFVISATLLPMISLIEKLT